MPNGFVLPMYKITRVWDGLAALSTRQGGTAEIARFYGEQVDSFTSNLKIGFTILAIAKIRGERLAAGQASSGAG